MYQVQQRMADGRWEDLVGGLGETRFATREEAEECAAVLRQKWEITDGKFRVVEVQCSHRWETVLGQPLSEAGSSGYWVVCKNCGIRAWQPAAWNNGVFRDIGEPVVN